MHPLTKLHGAVFCFFMCLSSKAAFSNILNCVEEQDIACIEREIRQDPKWMKRANFNNHTAFSLAIALKDKAADSNKKESKKFGSIAKLLIEHGAGNTEKDVIVTIDRLFRVGRDYFDVGSFDWRLSERRIEHKASMAERMLIAAVHNSQKTQILKNLSKVLDLFTSHVELATKIRRLRSKDLLSDSDLKLLMANYKLLFLQDEMPSVPILKEITRELLPLNVNKYLLLMIIDAHDLWVKKHKIPELVEIEDVESRVTLVRNAIMENTRIGYSGLLPAFFVRHLIMKEDIRPVQSFILESKKFARSVYRSIVYPEHKSKKKKNFKFWFLVYKRLLNAHDFRGAFPIGAALRACHELMEHKLYPELQLVESSFDYRNYREETAKVSNGNYFPDVEILVLDLGAFSTASFFEEDGKLNLLSLKQLAKLRSQMKGAYDHANDFRYEVDRKFLDVFQVFKSPDSEKEWLESYRILLLGKDIPGDPKEPTKESVSDTKNT